MRLVMGHTWAEPMSFVVAYIVHLYAGYYDYYYYIMHVASTPLYITDSITAHS